MDKFGRPLVSIKIYSLRRGLVARIVISFEKSIEFLNLYVLGPNPKIERADMDGSRRKSVIVDKIFWPNGLTIDYTDSKIYWADAKHHVIEKASFDGHYRKRVSKFFFKELLTFIFNKED